MKRFPPKAYGTWLTWYAKRHRLPGLIGIEPAQRRYRLQWLRSKSWRRTL